MSEIVYLNNSFLKKDDAVISPNDRGFIFADGIYEVIKYYKGHPFRYEDHLQRLERSLAEIGIVYNKVQELDKVFNELLTLNGKSNQDVGVYVQITRGAAPRVHYFPQDVKPTVYAFVFDLPSFTQKLDKGIKVITQDDIRWHRCDIKSVSLLPNTMLFNKAHENGAGESILIRDGFVTEATHSSVFAVKNGKIVTRLLSNLILPGITRKVVLEICKANNIEVEERLFTKEELFDMDEVFISGTGSEIMPVVEVDDVVIGNKEPGEITRLIQNAFFELVNTL